MIKPKLDTIVVVQDEQETISKGGIELLPEDQSALIKKEMKGEIVEVGPGKYDKKGNRTTMWDLKVGDRISFTPVCSVPVFDGGKKYLLIKRDSVIGLT